MNKKEFSTYLSKITLTDQTLEISGRRRLAALLMFGFLLVCLWLFFNVDMPLFPTIGLAIGNLILVWGVLDVFFSENYLLLKKNSDYIEIRRRSIKHSFKYYGSGKKFLRIACKKMISSEDDDKFYNVVLYFENDEVKIPFVLSNFGIREANVDSIMKDWQDKLNLPVELLAEIDTRS